MSTNIQGSPCTDGRYHCNNLGWYNEDSNWKAWHMASSLTANRVSPGRVWEVGCEAGDLPANLIKLFEPPAHFTGFELSAQAHAMCCGKAGSRRQFNEQNPFEPQALGSHDFDAAMSIDVFEPVEDCRWPCQALAASSHDLNGWIMGDCSLLVSSK